MRSFPHGSLGLAAGLFFAAGVSHAQVPDVEAEVPLDEAGLPPAPNEEPPAPPEQPPPPQVDDDGTPASMPSTAAGQWVHTAQYGWVWMPYADRYVAVEPAGDLAYAFVYYPTFGWTWVFAPWVLGWGPHPYWGALGIGHYGWHVRPWFRVGPRWRAPSWGARLHRGRVVAVEPPPSTVRQERHRSRVPQRPAAPSRRSGGRGHGNDRGRGRR